jgi:hypothetical protein
MSGSPSHGAVPPPIPPPPPVGEPKVAWLRRARTAAVIALALASITYTVVVPRIRALSSPCHQIQGMLRQSDLGRALASPGAALDETLFGFLDRWVVGANFSEDLELASRSAGDIDRIQLWKRALASNGFTRGWRRGWLPVRPWPGANSVTERVYEFRTSEDAQSFQRWASEDTCRFAERAFRPPEIGGAVGLRYSYRSGGQVEQVSFVAGKRRYVVAVGSNSEEPNRALLFQVLGYAVDQVTKVAIDAEPCREIKVFGKLAVQTAVQWNGHAIDRLQNLIPARAPYGFGRISTSRQGDSKFSRTWTDGVSVLRSSVSQFRSMKDAVGWFRKDSSAICEGAAAVGDSPEIPGSVLVMDQKPHVLIQRIVFIRGSRGYVLELIGPPSETPGEILQTLASRANAAAG